MHTSRRCSICTVPARYPHGTRTVPARYPHVLSLVADRFATIAQNYCGFYLGGNSLFSLPSLLSPHPNLFLLHFWLLIAASVISTANCNPSGRFQPLLLRKRVGIGRLPPQSCCRRLPTLCRAGGLEQRCVYNH